ncbi:MAG: hypothetical protein AB7G17_05790 [Phycisphaerales bacterium]
MRILSLAPFLSALLLSAPALPRDCDPRWLRGEGMIGVGDLNILANSHVLATTMWDPDGPGPRTPLLVLGGYFTIAGDQFANHIATFDPVKREWGTIAAGFNDHVHALLPLPNGELIAAGRFTRAGSTDTSQIAKWNGSAWLPLSTQHSAGHIVRSLTLMPNGDIIAIGTLLPVGSSSYLKIARWDGATWTPINLPATGSPHESLLLPNGDLVVTGDFTLSPGQYTAALRSDGEQWTPFGPPFDGGGRSLTLTPNGELLMVTAGYPNLYRVHRWDGATWTQLGADFIGSIETIHALDDGSLYAGGRFEQQTQQSFSYLVRWDGAAWVALEESLSGPVYSLTTLPDERLLVAGDFDHNQITYLDSIATWENNRFAPLADGLNHLFKVLARTPEGRILAASGSWGSPPDGLGLAEWDGVEWKRLPGKFNDSISAALYTPEGHLIVGGSFTSISGLPASRIARWNGQSWSPLASGCSGKVSALLRSPDDHIIAAGAFTTAGGVPARNIARWDGATWSPIGQIANGTINRLALLPSNEILAVGTFTYADEETCSYIARWDGQRWNKYGLGLQAASSGAGNTLLVEPDGSFVVGGIFDFAGGVPAKNIARWSGSAWSAFGSGMNSTVSALSRLTTGELVASGSFTIAGGGAAAGIARWTGSAWISMAYGSGSIVTLMPSLGGELMASGSFLRMTGFPSVYRARWTDTNIPWVARHPQPQSIDPSESASFSAWPATGYANLQASWQLETAPHSNIYADLIDGPIPNSNGAVASITPLLPSYRPGATTLTISNITPALHHRRVRALINNACGVSISNPALLTLNNAPCPGDANGDNTVNFLDLNLVLSSYGASVPPGTLGDLNSDGAVDFLDLNILLSYFGTTC